MMPGQTHRNMRGSIAMVVGILFVPMVLIAGALIDFGRAYVVRDQLRAALDATALAVAAETDETDAYLSERTQEFFKENYDPSAEAPANNPSLALTKSTVEVSASAQMETIFLGLVGYDTLPVRESVEAVRRTKGLEVVLVLDITGSMAYGGNMDAMREAATDLVRILFGNKENPDQLKVSVVPFATAVNIGGHRTDLLKNYDSTAFTDYGTDWKGCVEARPYPDDVKDSTPSSGGHWEPYRWPMEPAAGVCTNPAENPAMKDYDYIDETPAPTMGPNKGCGQPIMPFKSDRSKVIDKIQGLHAWNHGGTEAHLGMAWGMRMLSPKAPFNDAKKYGNEDWDKAIIVLTDGQNQLWLGDTHPKCSSDYGGPEGPYAPYGYALSNDRLDVDDTDGSRTHRNNLINEELDDRMLEVCENIKAQGESTNSADIYTITFKVGDSDTQDLFRNCATGTDNYFNSPTNEELKDVFRSIGAELQTLRLAQ